MCVASPEENRLGRGEPGRWETSLETAVVSGGLQESRRNGEKALGWRGLREGSQGKGKNHFWPKHWRSDTGTELEIPGETSDSRDIAYV